MDERIKTVMSQIMNLDSQKINENSSPDNIDTWNSLSHMDLVMALEAEFDVDFSPEEALDMMSFRLIKLIIEERLVGG